MSEYPDVLKFDQNVIYQVTMLWDKPLKPVEGQYGTFIPYRVDYEGTVVSINASEVLDKLLIEYKKGDVVTIRKEKKGNEPVKWNVTSNGKATQKPYDPHYAPVPENGQPTNSEPDWDLINAKKTHDIHKQVCMKLAVDSMGYPEKNLIDWDLTEITKRTNQLMTVLDSIQFEDSTSSEEQKGLNPGMIKNIETLAEKFWGNDWTEQLNLRLMAKYGDEVNIDTYKKLLTDEQGLNICTGLKEAIAKKDGVNPADVQNSLKNTQDLERMDEQGMRDLYIETLRNELKLSKTAALLHADKVSLQTHSKEFNSLDKDEIRTLLLKVMKKDKSFDRAATIEEIVELIPKMGGEIFEKFKRDQIGNEQFNKLPEKQLIKFLEDMKVRIKK